MENANAIFLAKVEAQPEDKLISMLSDDQRKRLEGSVAGQSSCRPLECFLSYCKFKPTFRWVEDEPDPLLVVTVDGVERSARFPLFWIMQNSPQEQGAELRGMLAVLCA